MKSIQRYYRMDRRQIHYFRFILEACEGVGVLSTLDPAAGLVTLRIAPGRESEAQQLVEDLKGRIMIEPVPDVPGPCPETGTTIAAKYADKAR